MPTGPAPTGSVSSGNVTLNWSAVTLSGGGAVGGYIVKRYNTSDVLQTIGSNCNTTVTGLTCTENSVPAGTWRYRLTPVLQGWTGTEGPATEVVVVNPPVVTGSVIASTPGNGAGFVKEGGTYIVYATITGAVTTATANVNNVTSGSTAVALSACSPTCVVDGVNYNFKSGTLTANNPLSGTPTYTVTASNAGGSHTASFSVTVDNTAPTPSPTSLVLRNNGAVIGIPEVGDTIEVTFSEELAVNTLCSGWTNNSGNQNAMVDVTLVDDTEPGAGPRDSITFGSASCGTFTFGSIDIGGKNYLQAGNMLFTASGVSWNVSTKTLTITLQNQSGNPASGNNANLTSVYTPHTSIRDLAGNAITGTAASPSGRQF